MEYADGQRNFAKGGAKREPFCCSERCCEDLRKHAEDEFQRMKTHYDTVVQSGASPAKIAEEFDKMTRANQTVDIVWKAHTTCPERRQGYIDKWNAEYLN